MIIGSRGIGIFDIDYFSAFSVLSVAEARRCSGCRVLKIQAVDDVLQGEFRVANSSIGCTVIDSEPVIFTEQSTGKNHVSEEAFTLIVGLWLEDRLSRSCHDPPGLLAVQQYRSEAIAIVSIDSVVDFQPALPDLQGDGAGSDLHLVPAFGAGAEQVAMVAPCEKVGRFCKPDVLPLE